MIAAGIGTRAAAGPDEMVAAVRQAAMLAKRRPELLAVPWFRDGAAVREAARKLGLTMRVISREEMLAVEARCPSRSERARAAYGVAAVAEGCALAACAGRPEAPVLLLPRIAVGGVTCAVAGFAGERRQP